MKYATGALESKKDIRDFTYKPDKANWKGGTRYLAKDIEDQQRVGICTAISLTQNARKATGIKYSAEFQYLLQKKYIDGNWEEGSSIRSALKVASKYGLLPEKYFKYKISRNQPYSKYIKQLQAIPQIEIDKLIKKCIKIAGYASVPVDRDLMANAIDETNSGLLARFALGAEWWSAPIEPLRPPKKFISGHAVTISNYTGGSQRIANMWGDDWADKGTAYFILKDYAPTEAWIVYYNSTKGLEKQIKRKNGIVGKVKKLLQTLIDTL
jgi:hypothetical protein